MKKRDTVSKRDIAMLRVASNIWAWASCALKAKTKRRRDQFIAMMELEFWELEKTRRDKV